MTGLTVFKFVIETLLVLAIGYGFYREEDVIKLERKVFRFVKRFFRLVASELRKKKSSKKVNNIVELKANEDVEAQYEYLLRQVG